MKKIFVSIMVLVCSITFLIASNSKEFEEFNYDNYKAMAGALPNPKKFLYGEVTGLSFSKKHMEERKLLEENLRKKTDNYIDPIGPNKGVISMPPHLLLHYNFESLHI